MKSSGWLWYINSKKKLKEARREYALSETQYQEALKQVELEFKQKEEVKRADEGQVNIKFEEKGA